MAVRVVVENNTERAIHVAGCGTLFQVALSSKRYRPAVAWITCLQVLTIPVGRSSYRMTVEARYNGCSRGPSHDLRACLLNGLPPPLPPGDYHATLFQVRHVVPSPPPITVRVKAPGSGT
jgi:hypothetical protein